jgi:Uma2 family endonuclease
MSTVKPPQLLALEYERYAREYCASLPLEHFMESQAQGTQRKITLASLELVHARRPEVQVFNELLVQYPRPGQRKPGNVVPDNMVVVWHEPLQPGLSFKMALQPAPPFWVLEYVSKRNKGKDYKKSFLKYEIDLKVPYCLMFDPAKQTLALHRHNKRKYVKVKANTQGRHPIPQLELEVGLLQGWVRFWYQGELLPLPADLLSALTEARREAEEQRQRADAEHQARVALEREVETLRARLRQTQPPHGNGT